MHYIGDQPNDIIEKLQHLLNPTGGNHELKQPHASYHTDSRFQYNEHRSIFPTNLFQPDTTSQVLPNASINAHSTSKNLRSTCLRTRNDWSKPKGYTTAEGQLPWSSKDGNSNGDRNSNRRVHIRWHVQQSMRPRIPPRDKPHLFGSTPTIRVSRNQINTRPNSRPKPNELNPDPKQRSSCKRKQLSPRKGPGGDVSQR